MRAPLIGGPRHGTFVVVSEPPLDYLNVEGEPTGFGPRDSYRVERYRLTYWIDGNTISRVEYPVYLHTSIPDPQARPYVCDWFETGVIAPLEVPSA